ncbi:MAG: hypothetical protein V3S64_06220 [bacterium]
MPLNVNMAMTETCHMDESWTLGKTMTGARVEAMAGTSRVAMMKGAGAAPGTTPRKMSRAVSG